MTSDEAFNAWAAALKNDVPAAPDDIIRKAVLHYADQDLSVIYRMGLMRAAAVRFMKEAGNG